MGISDWFYYALSYFGFYPSKPAKLVFVGLDSAGKSSLSPNFASGLPGFALATLHPGLETLIKGNVSFHRSRRWRS